MSDPKDYAVLYLDGGGDPTFDQIDGFLYAHFSARAIYEYNRNQLPLKFLGFLVGQFMKYQMFDSPLSAQVIARHIIDAWEKENGR